MTAQNYHKTLDYCLALLRQQAPKLAHGEARLIVGHGQFNHVLCIDERWIVRFPKSDHAAKYLKHELTILPKLQGRLPLPIPNPQFRSADPESALPRFMAYAKLPGEPLLPRRTDKLPADARVLDALAQDLARFLRALHAIPPAELDLDEPVESPRDEWTRFYQAFRQQLYGYMRAAAREAVSRSFHEALANDELWRGRACLHHGDLGAANILTQTGRVSGIIDFGFCAVGDPAQDLGALLASCGEAFAARVCRHYPALGAGLPRARFYRQHYALIQALFALRDGDQEEFEEGIAAYR